MTRTAPWTPDRSLVSQDGTTDVTRTVHFGEPSEWEKECFTRVLRAHIAMDTAVFPVGWSCVQRVPARKRILLPTLHHPAPPTAEAPLTASLGNPCGKVGWSTCTEQGTAWGIS